MLMEGRKEKTGKGWCVDGRRKEGHVEGMLMETGKGR
jgi:hypothetical protein